MTRTLRFLLLAGLTFFVLGGAALEVLDTTDQNIFLNRLLESLGVVGSLLQLVLAINAVLLVQALVLAIPLGLIVRDAKRTAKRFGLTL